MTPARTKYCVAAVLGCAALVSAPGRSRANGALPQSLGILLAPDRPAEIVLATNFGLIISEDAGTSWLWTCEQAATSMGYLYGLGPAPRDRMYALSPEQGLALSDDGSCSWQRAGGVLASALASDYFVEPSNGARVLAVASTRTSGGGINPPALFASADGGSTFAEAPLYAAPAGGNIVGVEIARKNADVVYLATYTTPGRHPVLVRSDDGGQTWTPRDVEAGLGANEFRILAVDPADPDVLYVRVIAPGLESMAVTRDAGATFATPISIPNGALTAFARLASGTVLVAGVAPLPGGGGGTYGVGFRSTDGGLSFDPWTLCPAPHIVGLAERDGVLYVAGKNYVDGWALATSTDEGKTITPLSDWSEVRGVKPCAGEACAAACLMEEMAAVWPMEVCTGVLRDGGTGAGPPAAPVCGDAATDARAGNGGGGGGGSSGCHCAAAQSERRGGSAVAVVVLALAVARARRRARA